MTHVYFHCSNAVGLYLDKRGTEVENLIEAHQRAVQVVRDYISNHGPDNWRAWTLHVRGENGEDLFLVPFSCMMARPQ